MLCVVVDCVDVGVVVVVGYVIVVMFAVVVVVR